MDFPVSKVLQDEENRKRKYELCPRKNSEVEFVLWGVPKMCLSRKLQENDHACGTCAASDIPLCYAPIDN